MILVDGVWIFEWYASGSMDFQLFYGLWTDPTNDPTDDPQNGPTIDPITIEEEEDDDDGMRGDGVGYDEIIRWRNDEHMEICFCILL